MSDITVRHLFSAFTWLRPVAPNSPGRFGRWPISWSSGAGLLQLLGEFRMSYGGRTVPGVNTPRLRALLAYLLIHRRAPQRREHLAGHFWPDSPEAQARTNLRRELHHLRRVGSTGRKYGVSLWGLGVGSTGSAFGAWG